MERRPEHVDALRIDASLGRLQGVEIGHFESDMLNLFGCLSVATHFGLVGQFEKRQHVSAARIEENVHLRAIGTSGRHLVFRDGHAENTRKPVRRLHGVFASVVNVMNALNTKRMSHHGFSESMRSCSPFWAARRTNCVMMLTSPI